MLTILKPSILSGARGNLLAISTLELHFYDQFGLEGGIKVYLVVKDKLQAWSMWSNLLKNSMHLLLLRKTQVSIERQILSFKVWYISVSCCRLYKLSLLIIHSLETPNDYIYFSLMVIFLFVNESYFGNGCCYVIFVNSNSPTFFCQPVIILKLAPSHNSQLV